MEQFAKIEVIERPNWPHPAVRQLSRDIVDKENQFGLVGPDASHADVIHYTGRGGGYLPQMIEDHLHFTEMMNALSQAYSLINNTSLKRCYQQAVDQIEKVLNEVNRSPRLTSPMLAIELKAGETLSVWEWRTREWVVTTATSEPQYEQEFGAWLVYHNTGYAILTNRGWESGD